MANERATTRGAARERVRRLLSVIAIAAITLLLLECSLRVTNLDWYLLSRHVFQQGADTEAHEASDDPVLHYQLKPGGRAVGVQRGGYTVTIDEHGARGAGHPLAKAEDVTRVIFLGGSTTYGGEVNDDATMPAQLERILNERAEAEGNGRRFEVWNLGTSAYNLAQVATLGLRALERFDPDVLLVQLYNEGRRAFLVEDESLEDGLGRFVGSDPAFFDENLETTADERRRLGRYAVYRAWYAVSREPVKKSPRHKAAARALSLERAELLRHEASARGVPVLFVAIPAAHGCAPPGACEGLTPGELLDLHVEGREPAFYEAHPPAPILTEYAESIADWLVRRGEL